MSRKQSIVRRIDVDLDKVIKNKQLELINKSKKPITYLDTCSKISNIIAKINFDDEEINL